MQINDEKCLKILVFQADLNMITNDGTRYKVSKGAESIPRFRDYHERLKAQGEQTKFGMTIVKTYTSGFNLAMGEVIRILYRSKEKGVVLLNSKAGDICHVFLAQIIRQELGGSAGGSLKKSVKNVSLKGV